MSRFLNRLIKQIRNFFLMRHQSQPDETNFCVFLLHVTGGGVACHSPSKEGTLKLAFKKMNHFPNSYLLATVPYKINKTKTEFGWLWDTSVPKSIFKSWDVETQKKYLSTEN